MVYYRDDSLRGLGADYVLDPFTGMPIADPSGVLQAQGYEASPAVTATQIGDNTTQAAKDAAIAVGHAAAATYNFVTTAVKWGIVGIVAYAVIEVVGAIPHAKSYGRARVKHYRRRAARAISRRIAGE